MRFKSVGIALALSVVAAPAMAERIELREKDLTAVEPASAYVLMTSEGAGSMQIFRRAPPDEIATWEVKRAKAYKNAEAAYAEQLKFYKSKKTDPVTRRPYGKPDPVDETFYYNPPELRNFINVMGRRFIKDQDYILLKLVPGDYVIYTLPGEGTGAQLQGQCLCMGSVGFSAEAGKIVSVGRFSGMVSKGEYRFVPADPKDPMPTALNRFGVSPARLWAVGKLPNFNGSIIARVGAVPGILSYLRDLPVDAAGQPAVGLR